MINLDDFFKKGEQEDLDRLVESVKASTALNNSDVKT